MRPNGDMLRAAATYTNEREDHALGLHISDDELQAGRLSADELRREIAVFLFQQDRFTLGQASLFAGMSQLDFQRLLASRRIPVHYGVPEFEADLLFDRLSGGGTTHGGGVAPSA